MAGPQQAMKVVADTCSHRGTLLGAVRVLHECPSSSSLPPSVVTRAFKTFAAAKEHSLCHRAGHFVEQLSRPLLPRIFSPPPTSAVTLKCVRAHLACGRDFLCSANIKATASMGLSHVLQETAKLCTSKVSMLRALTVAVECPGAHHSAEAHLLRRNVARTSKPDLCRRTSQLLPEVPGHFMTGNPIPFKCLSAHRKCGADSACATAVGRMVSSSNNVKSMLDETLGLC